MKKILFLSFAALCFAVTANAQRGDGGGRGGDNQQFIQSLNLTPDQQAQFQSIDSAQHAKMQSLKSSGASRDQFRAAMQDGNAQKRAILTPDQQTKWDQYQAQRKQRMQQRQQQDQSGGNGGDNTQQSGGGGN